jgi:hypothetical protein
LRGVSCSAAVLLKERFPARPRRASGSTGRGHPARCGRYGFIVLGVFVSCSSKITFAMNARRESRSGSVTLPRLITILAFLVVVVAGYSLTQRVCLVTLGEECSKPEAVDGASIAGFLSYTADIDERNNSNPAGSNRSEVFITCGAEGLVSYTSCLLRGTDLPPGAIREEANDEAFDEAIVASSTCFRQNLEGYLDCLDEAWLSWRGKDVSEGGRIISASPDGRYLAYIVSREQDGELSSNLRISQADGSDDRFLVSLGCLLVDCGSLSYQQIRGQFLLPPAWSPDATYLAFGARTDDGSGIFLIRPDGTGLRHLTRGRDLNPIWSPEGKRILYESQRGECQELRVIDLASGLSRRITKWPRFSVEGLFMHVMGYRRECRDHSPVWSPDGTQIAFMSNHRNGAGVFIVDADGRGLRRLTGPPARLRHSDNNDLQWR